MCDIVTVEVDRSKSATIQGFRSEGFDVSTNDDRSLAGLFGPEKAAFDVTIEGCSCAFYLDSVAMDIDADRLRRKYRKKGWSEAKIHRALSQMQHTPALLTTQRLRESFVTAVETVVMEAGRIQLFSHFYDGPMPDELKSLKNCGRQSISLRELGSEPGYFPQDCVLSVSSEDKLLRVR